MKIAFFDTRSYDKKSFLSANESFNYEIDFREYKLNENTGRGELIDSKALVHALKHGHIGGIGMDVYEEESAYFFSDWSTDIMTDDVLARLLTFPNVIITSHQAFLTTNALKNLADTTLQNIQAFISGQELVNEVSS